MHEELADHIALLAAPIYAALLVPWLSAREPVSEAKYNELRQAAIIEATLLRRMVLSAPFSG